MSGNLIEGILKECERVRELRAFCVTIGPDGLFAIAGYDAAIFAGEAAVASGEAIDCVRALAILRDCE